MTTEIFCRILEEDCGLLPGAHVLCAVSGGADSVALLCLLADVREKLGVRVSAAHVEHGIRGEDSVQDMAFVRDLCVQKNIDFYARRVDAPAYAKKTGCGLEAAARELRYAFLKETREAIGADVIAVAHHSGDQAETVLMHAARGSDLRGLCAMRLKNESVIRPLLHVSAAQLRAYLTQRGQAWREDATNADPAYTRNRIRTRVLPELERAYPGAEGALSRLALSAQRDEDFFLQQIASLGLEIIPLVDGAAMKREGLSLLHDALLSRVIVRLMEATGVTAGSRAVDEIVRAIHSDGDTFAAAVGEKAEVRLGKRYLSVTRPDEVIPDIDLRIDAATDTPFGTFLVRRALPGETGNGAECQIVPKRLLEGAVVSVRREGDAMIPFGQHTMVKLKKLLIDSGVERAMRRSVPVLRSRAGILWLPGVRPCEVCRATIEEERMMIVFRRAECVKIQ